MEAVKFFPPSSWILDDEFFGNLTSEHTRRSYRSDITRFIQAMIEIYPESSNKCVSSFDRVTRAHIVKYRNWLQETGGHDGNPCAPKTVARKLAALSSYFDFLTEKGICNFNPVSSVKRPRREVLSPTKALGREQVLEIFAAIDSQGNKSRYLHKALLVTFFTTGLRKSEVLHLQFKHYREINEFRVLEFIGKGGKVGQKVLHPICIEALDEYIEWMKSEERELGPEDWLFQPTRNPSNPGHLNKPLNPKTINEILLKYGKKIGLNFNISPHSARATFIGELLEAGVDIYSVAKEVNHSSVKTTQEYDKRRHKLANSPVHKLRY